jgi:type IV pilus assembly protein PilA
MNKKQKGFSLIELLIVVAIILIIAAIAIPNLLQARISANEASAAQSLRSIKTAEYAYFNTYPNIGYGANIGVLGGTGTPCVPTPLASCLLDNVLATAIPGSSGKSGYIFLATGVATSGGINNEFVTGASPVTVNQTGNQHYCSTDDGVLRSGSATVGETPVTVPATCYAFPVAQ